jgi:hypothetical protein
VSINGHVFFVTFHVKPSSTENPDLAYQLRWFTVAHGFEFYVFGIFTRCRGIRWT